MNTNLLSSKKLGLLQKEVYQILKDQGFKKQGRTYNKAVSSDLVHVINFQMSNIQKWHFTINLGVWIKDVAAIVRPETVDKKILQSWDCPINERVGFLVQGQDYWWDLNSDNNRIIKELIRIFGHEVPNWFKGLQSTQLCVQHLQQFSGKRDENGFLDPRLLSLVILLLAKDPHSKTGTNTIKELYADAIRMSHEPYENSNFMKQIEIVASHFGVKLA